VKKSLFPILSLLLNVSLFSILLATASTRRSQPVKSAPPSASEPLPPQTRADPTNGSVAVTVTDSFHWASIESTNYAAFRDNLRAIGCPVQTIRDIIEADLRATLNAPAGK